MLLTWCYFVHFMSYNCSDKIEPAYFLSKQAFESSFGSRSFCSCTNVLIELNWLNVIHINSFHSVYIDVCKFFNVPHISSDFSKIVGIDLNPQPSAHLAGDLTVRAITTTNTWLSLTFGLRSADVSKELQMVRTHNHLHSWKVFWPFKSMGYTDSPQFAKDPQLQVRWHLKRVLKGLELGLFDALGAPSWAVEIHRCRVHLSELWPSAFTPSGIWKEPWRCLYSQHTAILLNPAEIMRLHVCVCM